MGHLAVPIFLGMSAYTAVEQVRAGKAQAQAIENESKRAIEQAKSDANERQLERLEALNDALSTTIASGGASGAGLGGSTYNIIKSDIESYGSEQGRFDRSLGIQIAGIRESGKNRAEAAKQAGRLGAASTLVSAASAFVVPGSGGGKPTPKPTPKPT